jgi:hypothetical protein
MFLFAGSGLVCQRGEVDEGQRGETRGLLTMGWDKPCFWLREMGGQGNFLEFFSWWDLLFLLPDIFFGGETSLDNFFFYYFA